MHAHRATQTKRRPKDRIDATRASRASSLATMDTRAKLARQVGKTPHPNDMLAMLAGTRSPLFKHGLLLTLQRGERTLQMRHRAHPAPKATTALELHLCLKYAKTYRRTALLAPPHRKSPKQARTQIRSAQRRSRAKKAFTARADVASSAHQDLTALLE